MKIKTSQDQPPKFNPVDLTIIFESQAELDAFGSLFNTSRIACILERILPGYRSDLIYRQLQCLGADISKHTTEFHNK